MKRLAVFFPGIGYTADKPLLYYSRKLAAELSYEVLTLSYGGFPKKPKGDPEKLKACFRLAVDQAAEQLTEVRWKHYDEIVFVAKSIGTAVAAELAAKCPAQERIRFVLYTPVEELFSFPLGEALAFTGAADPWVGGAESRVPALCQERGISCRVFPGANHSLETGDLRADLETILTVMKQTEAFLRRAEETEN